MTKSNITLYSGLALRNALVEHIIPSFTEGTGITVDATFEPTTVLIKLIDSGARPDVFIGVDGSVRAIAEAGVLQPSSVETVARSSIGYAVAAGAVAPEFADGAAFLEYLLSARSVAYTRTGASGIAFSASLERLGLAARINERATVFESGFTAEALLDGRADVAIQQMSELASVAGVQVVGPVPAELQTYTTFAVGVGGTAPKGAEQFARCLSLAASVSAFADSGLETAQ
ncbi:molybdate transport system substrate-binding protein [Mycobacterium frederiksbergense]|uniref:Molybdate transport system substrate-binding protein n=1 Tax=Mycolicibacterium frederiksbergense TaxID=117567 RepID=A0ABT6L2L6_9MYCO|nr:substrate-binding domain-containing protein [Mycolicibacterium frederiksbergense]MDH6196846.1 molybdate transport system substrate-binding protein [Mycolicibacterium frederiksbergense]